MESAKDKYLTIQHVAERLSCAERHIYMLIQDGKLPAVKIGAKALRIPESAFEEFILNNIVNPDDYFAPVDQDPAAEDQRPANPARPRWMQKR